MKMKIVGYSERGAMNALFYGMALSNAEEDMKEFLKLSGIKDSFHDFELYMEPSLSDFGDCDLIFTAKNKKDELCAFFVEAKVSAQSMYNLKEQLRLHESDMQSKKKKEHSNLFYQLREKYELMTLDENVAEEGCLILDKIKPKKIGKNTVVLHLYGELRKSKKQYYLAVIPEQEAEIQREYFGFNINYVYWEKLLESEFYGKYLKDTFEFNYKDKRHQILNNISQEGDVFTQNLGRFARNGNWTHVSLIENGDEIIAKEKVWDDRELHKWKSKQDKGPIRLIDELLKYIFGDHTNPCDYNHVRHDLLKALGATIYYAKEKGIGKVCLQYDQETRKDLVEELCGCVGLELNGEAKTLNGVQVRIEWN